MWYVGISRRTTAQRPEVSSTIQLVRDARKTENGHKSSPTNRKVSSEPIAIPIAEVTHVQARPNTSFNLSRGHARD